VKTKLTMVVATKKEVDENSKVLTDLEVVPTLSPKELEELERHEQVILEMQSSLKLDA